MNVLELENPIKRIKEEKRKRRKETKDAMHIKQTRQGAEKMKDVDLAPSHSQEEVGTNKRKKGSTRWINIDDFLLGRGSNVYDLVVDESAQGPSITWPQLLHLLPKLRPQWSKIASTKKGRI